MKKNLILSLIVFFMSSIFMSSSALAVRACTWTPGAQSGSQYVEIPSPDGIIAVNDGKYPFPTNFTYAKLTPNAEKWSLTCTAPVQVTPVLQVFRTPDTRFGDAWPNLQTTTANDGKVFYYSEEMWYNGPAGDKTYFRGASGSLIRAPSFILAENATKDNPVIITAADLGANNVAFQGYQVANAANGSFTWGIGGTLNYLRFYMTNYTSNDKTEYNDFYFTYYIDHINFAVRTCAIVSNDLNKNIQLGKKVAADFSSSDVGGTTMPVEFGINLRCLPNVTVTYKLNTSTPDTENDPSNSLGLIKLQGNDSAIGYAIQLRALPFKQSNGSFIPVKFNLPISSTTQTTGDAVGNVSSDFIRFDARYYRTLPISRASAGSANATATIDINYQ